MIHGVIRCIMEPFVPGAEREVISGKPGDSRKPGADLPESMDRKALRKPLCGTGHSPMEFTHTVRIFILFCGRLDKLCSDYYLSSMEDILTMERL